MDSTRPECERRQWRSDHDRVGGVRVGQPAQDVRRLIGGQNGCVGYLFTKKGQIVIDNSEGELDEEKVMEDCFDAGAEDVDFDEDTIEVFTGVNELREVREARRLTEAIRRQYEQAQYNAEVAGRSGTR